MSPRSVAIRPYFARRPISVTVAAGQTLAEVWRKRPPQVAAPQRNARDALALQHGAQAAYGGLDFGKLGHGEASGTGTARCHATARRSRNLSLCPFFAEDEHTASP